MREITNKHKWTHDDEIQVFIAWRLAGENASEASKSTDVPLPTIRSWVKRWKTEGFSDGENQLVAAEVNKTIIKAGRIVDKALDRLEAVIESTDNVGHLIAAVDKLSAHIRLAQGKATVIREDRQIDSGSVTDAIKGYLESMATATTQRANEVIEIDPAKVEEQPPLSGADSSQPKD